MESKPVTAAFVVAMVAIVVANVVALSPYFSMRWYPW